MNWIVIFIYGCIGLALFLGSYRKWQKLSKNSLVDDSMVSLRQRYRYLAIWGMLLLMAAMDYTMTEISENNSLNTLILVGILIGSTSRILFEPYYKASVAEKIECLCLYLRPFKTDQNNAFKDKKGYARNKWGIPESIEKLLCTTLDKKIASVFAIGDPNSNLPTTLGTSNLYANDAEWKHVIRLLAQKASVLIIRVGQTEGCMWEVKHCIENEFLNKTLFIIEDDSMLEVVKTRLAGITTDIPAIDFKQNSSIALYMDENCTKWNVKIMKSESDIHHCVKDYIETHPLLQASLNRERKNRNIWSNLFNAEKIPAKGWQTLSFLFNPIAYCLVNKWSFKWWGALISYSIFSFMVALSTGLACIEEETDEELMILVFLIVLLVCMLPWLWLVPKISWSCHNWGSKYIFSKNNRILALWLVAYSGAFWGLLALQIFIA